MLQHLRWLVHGWCLLGAATLASGQTFYDLGAGRAYGINDAGLIVGSKAVAPGTMMPCKWKGWDLDGKGTDGATTVLPLPAGASSGEARSVNAQGLMVGSTTDSLMHAWPCKWKGWDLDSSSLLPDPDAGGVAYSVNSSGLMVGSTTDTLMHAWPCKWKGWDLDSKGTLPTPPGATGGTAFGVNNAGLMVGSTSDTLMSPWPCKWKGWDLDGYGALPVLPGAVGGVAYAANDSSLIVGSSTDTLMHAWPCKWKGWDLDSVDPLPVSGDGTGGAALAVSSQNKIAGYIVDAGGNLRAALWSPLGDGSYALADLNSFLPAGSGWQLQSAQAINSDGWIVGYGLYNGLEHGFVITPEPGTILLGGAGGLLLLRRRRRA
jgi:uncharacterized membrane protein